MFGSRSTTLATVLFTVALGLPIGARAGALYDGLASLTLTLTAIDGGATIPTGVAITYAATVFGQYTNTEGTGSAAAVQTLAPGDILEEMSVGDFIGQVSHSFGQAGEGQGTATSLLQTSGILFIDNQSGAAVSFSFAYSFSASVEAMLSLTGVEAMADATWLLTDDLGLVSLWDGIFADAIAGPSTNTLALTDSFVILLQDGEADWLLSAVDTQGSAGAPEPPAWALLLLGLVLPWVAARHPA